MPLLTVVANFQVPSDQTDHVKTELEKLLPISRREDGCIQYDLHENLNDDGHFLLYETWESRALWERHAKAPHISAFLKATKDVDVELTVHQMKHVD
ncbi:putative quinol monooxygenase [Woeseia oceani]|uniref:Antibiotic biosynthesis monooxygenase n=1 Tax=Woeseia oceani TaxID=1548547 RepID=A0A193LDW6_9GAMM|nr:putative quinol monooxygenase [Woeseia oceani]ANO50702.1 antibiotic biosynthesis monooxygenase [Woeseia oceani]